MFFRFKFLYYLNYIQYEILVKKIYHGLLQKSQDFEICNDENTQDEVCDDPETDETEGFVFIIS